MAPTVLTPDAVNPGLRATAAGGDEVLEHLDRHQDAPSQPHARELPRRDELVGKAARDPEAASDFGNLEHDLITLGRSRLHHVAIAVVHAVICPWVRGGRRR